MGRKKADIKKTIMSTSVWPKTKEYFDTHAEKPGQVLDDYVQNNLSINSK